MSRTPSAPVVTSPRWDGRRVLFELMDGDNPVTCAISPTALQELSAQRRFRPADLLECFAAARSGIEAAAMLKFRSSAASASGILSLWSEDVEDLRPAAAAQARRAAGPA